MGIIKPLNHFFIVIEFISDLTVVTCEVAEINLRLLFEDWPAPLFQKLENLCLRPDNAAKRDNVPTHHRYIPYIPRRLPSIMAENLFIDLGSMHPPQKVI